MKKILILVVLGIPVIIAVILRFFGDNQYQIPIFYSHGLVNQDCKINTDNQYRVPELTEGSGLTLNWNDKISICYFYTDSNKYSIQSEQELRRVFSTNRDPVLLHIYALGNEIEFVDQGEDSEYLQFTNDQLEDLAKCIFLISENEIYQGNSAYEYMIMIDGMGRIRGYYDSSDTDEYERLSAEADILKLEMLEGE